MKYDIHLVAAALDELSKASQEGSLDSAQIVVDAFHDLKPHGKIVTKTTIKKKGGSIQGQTDLGNVNMKNEDKTITKIGGTAYTRIGKWKIWKQTTKNNISRIWFTHFLSQDINDSERDRDYFLEYDDVVLTPRSVGYLGEKKVIFSFLCISFAKRLVVPIFGKVPKIKGSNSIRFRF